MEYMEQKMDEQIEGSIRNQEEYYKELTTLKEENQKLREEIRNIANVLDAFGDEPGYSKLKEKLLELSK